MKHQQAMNHQESMYNLFFNNFPDGVLRVSSHGIILGINKQAEQMLGWQETELLNTCVHEHLCPDDNEFGHDSKSCFFTDDSLVEYAKQLEHDNKKLEQWWVKKDGVFLHVEARIFIVQHTELEANENKIIGDSQESNSFELFVIFTDASQLKFSQAETKRLSLFPELNPSPVLQLDANSIIFYANSSMTDLMVQYGFSNIGFPNILPDNLREIVSQCIAGNIILNIEKLHADKCYSWNFHFVSEDNHSLIQVYGLDITERKLYEKSLTEMVDLLESHSQQKSDFLSNMSHELRTPMNGILGMSHLLMDSELTDVQFDFVDKIEKSSESLLMLVNDILDLSKIEAGKLELDPISFNLIDVMYETIDLLDYQAQKKNINLEFRVDPLIPSILVGDSLRIRQIILNFLTNAIKFSHKNGYVFLNISHEKEIENNYIELHFQVDDEGVGIAQDRLKYVFGKYNQAEKSTSRNYGGTGLGLAISKELAELMGGSVGLMSTEGKGSSFWLKVNLPLDVKEETLNAFYNQDTNPFTKSLTFASKTCLLVGGFPISSNIIEELLKYWGMKTVFFEETTDALKWLTTSQTNSENSIDLILLFDTVNDKEIKQFAKQSTSSRLICIKQSISSTQMNQLEKLGFDAFLTKPIHPEKFKNILLSSFDPKRQIGKQPILSVVGADKKHRLNVQELKKFNLNVLLAEDNLINQKISKALLEKMGCRVELAADGVEVIEQFMTNSVSGHYPDIIFMDCHMPQIDGFEATLKIRDFEKQHGSPHVPIVALTANRAQDEQEKTKQAGMDNFLSKPIDKNKLIEILQSIQRQKENE